MSNYAGRDDDDKVRESDWESEGGNGHYASIERICARCKGLGEDRDGADCVHCEGMGSVYI